MLDLLTTLPNGGPFAIPGAGPPSAGTGFAALLGALLTATADARPWAPQGEAVNPLVAAPVVTGDDLLELTGGTEGGGTDPGLLGLIVLPLEAQPAPPTAIGPEPSLSATGPAGPVRAVDPAATASLPAGGEPPPLPSGRPLASSVAETLASRAGEEAPRTPLLSLGEVVTAAASPSPRTVAGPSQTAAPVEGPGPLQSPVTASGEGDPATTGTGLDPSPDFGEVLRGGDKVARSQDPSPILSRPVASPAAGQVEVHLARAVHGRIDRLVVQLEPMDLGKVEIRLEFSDEGRVGALISAERPETLEALQRDAHALERSLREAGLRPDGGGLSFDLKRGSSDGGGQAGRPPGPDQAPVADEPLPAENRSTSLRLLDIRA